ncbi:MAG: NUDIX domain-containing protein [Candidatus Wildermuthbacteria bacterium]|nr:NUDIX domain-containing protein [Candidatus Wildermuthbacteria bacterium]
MEIQNRELHRVVGTAIIYKKEDGIFQYLLLKRSLDKKAFPGKWTVPGGGLEADDYLNTPKTTNDSWYFALENSLKREVKEETNMDIGKPKYLLDLTFIRPDGIPVLTLSFYTPYEGGEVRLNNENIEYAWASYEEAREYDLIEGILEEIAMVEKLL